MVCVCVYACAIAYIALLALMSFVQDKENTNIQIPINKLKEHRTSCSQYDHNTGHTTVNTWL